MISTLLYLHLAMNSVPTDQALANQFNIATLSNSYAKSQGKPTKPPAKPPAKPKPKPAAKPNLKLSNDKEITIPIRLADTAIIADAVVNGVKVSCMFDTGFSGAFVLDKGMDVGKPDGTMNLRDFVGQFEAKTVSIKSLKFGNDLINHEDMVVVQQGRSFGTESYGMHCDGIMGLEIAKNHTLEIDFQNKKMVLHPRKRDIIAERMKDKTKPRYLISMLPKGKSSIQLPVTTPSGKAMILALDTGNSFYATTHRDVLIRTGLWKESDKPKFLTQAQVASGPVDSWYMYMNDLNMWGVPVKGSVWSIIDLPSSSSEHDGTVGFGFLKNFDIIIDVSRRQVLLEPFTADVGNKPEAEPGFSPFYVEELQRFVVGRVMSGSPAEKAGIKFRDIVLSIDGEELLNRGDDHMDKILKGPKGSKMKVVLSRNGNLIRLEVERGYLINGNIP